MKGDYMEYTAKTTDAQLERIRQAAYPLVKLLQEEYDPHTTVLVENDHVTLKIDSLGIPFPMNF